MGKFNCKFVHFSKLPGEMQMAHVYHNFSLNPSTAILDQSFIIRN